MPSPMFAVAHTFGSLVVMLGLSALLFTGICALAWGVERLVGSRVLVPRDGHARFSGHAPMTLGASLGLALRHALWVIPLTLALSWVCMAGAKALGIDLPRQDLLDWLLGDEFTPAMKGLVIAFALVEAPIIEEILFRRFLYRACLRAMPDVWAVAVSSAVFAGVHRNLAVFLPILFLGSAFAVLYRRSGRLITTVFAHFLFNLTNVVLVFACPELA